jgi:caspase domain-containing protein
MRKALVIGVDYYEHVSGLHGAVNDAYAVKAMLDRHADGSVNFGTNLLAATGATEAVSRGEIKEAIRELFSGDGEVALLYFAGHGYLEATGGYLCGSETRTGDDGVSLAEVMTLANQSRFLNRVILLDSCHSGGVGQRPTEVTTSELGDGITVLTASTAEQYASEENGSGVFTSLLIDALGGSASNLVGDVTPGAVYAHIDQSLGPWAQRPVFKTNVKRFVSLRRVDPPVDIHFLRRIAEFFPEPGFQFQLDPSFEPERPEPRPGSGSTLPSPDPVKTVTFSILQQFNRVGLLVPEGAPHMWHAAMQSKCVRLTALGEHYRNLAERGRL